MSDACEPAMKRRREDGPSSDPSSDESASLQQIVEMRLKLLDTIMQESRAALKMRINEVERDVAVRCAVQIGSCCVAVATSLNSGDADAAAASAKNLESCLKFLGETVGHGLHRGRSDVLIDLAKPLLSFILLRKDGLPQTEEIPSAQLRSLAGSWGNLLIPDAIGFAAKNGLLDFPWKRLTMGDPVTLFRGVQDRILERREDPVKGVPNVHIGPEASRFIHIRYKHSNPDGTSRDGYLCFNTTLDDYFKADILTDYYQEEPRLSAIRAGESQTVLELWRSGRAAADAARYCLEHDKDLSTFELREALYHMKYKECTLFKSTLTRSVFDLYNARRVLDFSAGWGDRLLGAIAAKSVERYVGVDPNEALRAGHDSMRHTFCPLAGKDPNAFTVVYDKFETATLPDDFDTYDLVYTSPPFFDFEVYTDAEHSRGQSVTEFPTFERWAAHFLLASMQKAWSRLAPDGHMGIYITDVSKSRIVELIGLYAAARLPDCEFLGAIISIGDTDKPRPTWVWHKLPPSASSASSADAKQRQADAESLLRKYHSRIVHELDKP